MSDKRKEKLSLLGKGMLILMAFVTLGFATHSHKNRVCEEILINVDISNNMHFVSSDDVLEVLATSGVQAQGQRVGDIDLSAIEKTILNIPSVENAAVYTTVGGKLQIDVVQRTPVVRIFNRSGSSYYLDVNGVPMPLSKSHTARALPFTGVPDNELSSSWSQGRLLKDTIADPLLEDVFILASYIEQDPFLKALIVQVEVNNKNEFILIPRVGDHDILFGRSRGTESRFNKLKIFYDKGLRKSDRRKYDRIDLRFEDQIVCTKKRIL